MKLKSSAVLIALTIGLILSATVFTAAAVMSLRSQTMSRSIEGNIARAAAMSGVQDGLLKYQYALSSGKAEDAFADFGENTLVQGPSLVKYSLKIVNESVGAALDGAYYGSWPNVDLEKASQLKADESIDLNLSKLGENLGKLSSLTVYFSQPYYLDSGKPAKLDDAFTALSYRLVNGDPGQSTQDQIISEKTNTQIDAILLNVEKISLCVSGSSCHLRIRPQVASKSQAFDPATKKLVGTGSDKEGKFIYYVIEAKFEGGGKINTDAKIGTVRIISVGKTGRTSRKVETIVDSSSGAYLGLFDFGLYCGNQCTGS